MASTVTDIPNLDLSGGLVTAEPPLLQLGQWYKQQNVRWDGEKRKLVGLPALQAIGVIAAGNVLNVLPSKMGSCHLILLSDRPYTVKHDASSLDNIVNSVGAAVLFNGTDGVKGSDWPLWGFASARYSGYLWFVNEFNSLAYTDGACWRTHTSEAQPYGRYLMSFFDHLVIGWPTYLGCAYPWRVMWSDLYKPNRWAPAQGSECDHFDLEDWGENLPLYNGITGMAKSRDVGWIFTSNSIVGMRYVGLPKIMQFNSVIEDIGCTSPKSLVSFGGLHYFFNERENNFFVFDGQSVKPIGDSIKTFLKSNVVSGVSFFYNSCAFVDERYDEIQWFFATTDSAGKGVAYNYKTGRWHEIGNLISTGRVVSATNCNLNIRKAAKHLTGTAGALTGIMERLGTGGNALTTLYWTSPKPVPTLYQTSTTWTGAEQFGAPLLETGDRIYGDLYSVKETTALTIHGSTKNGMKVSLSTRNNLEDSVSFSVVGTWTGTEGQNRLTFPRRYGRIMRWRFEDASGSCENFALQGFVEHILGIKKAEE